MNLKEMGMTSSMHIEKAIFILKENLYKFYIKVGIHHSINTQVIVIFRINLTWPYSIQGQGNREETEE